MVEFINENRILPTSQTYIQVFFKVFKKNTDLGPKNKDPAINFYIDSDGKDYGYIVLNKHYIQNAEFSGVAIGARNGKISIIDPEGAWANCLQYIGSWKNANAASPNMTIKFGWLGLKPNGSDSKMIQEIPAILLKTSFGLSEDGAITIELNFIENMENLLRDIKFSYLEDMKLLDSSINNNNIKSKKISEILKHITTKSDSIKEQLSIYQLALYFEDTFETGDQAYGEDNKNIKIRLGDTLGDKINELIVSTIPSNKNDNNYTWSYEIIKKETYTEPVEVGKNINGITYTKGISCKIYFGWRKAPKKSAENMTPEEQRLAFSSGPEEVTKGPTLLWKKHSNNINEKSLISFDIDLKMLDYAASMIRSDLDKKLSNINDESWDKIYEGIKSIRGEDAYMLSLPLSALAQTVKSNAQSHTVGLNYSKKSGLFGLLTTENDRQISQAMEEFNTILAEASNNVQNQIETIINNNVFKAKAKIIGDPTIGTTNTVYKVGFNTDFEAVGYFANFFNRFWLLTSSVHKIEEGGYFTEIELLALPVKPDTSGPKNNRQVSASNVR